MRFFRFVALPVLLGLPAVGCGVSHAPPADVDQARSAFKTALESWKKGERPNSLESHAPPISFSDVNWDKGDRLIDYKLSEGGSSGRQVRVAATLTLQDKEGATRDVEASYLIDTGERIVIVQEDI